jgi:hypothetical protein
LFAAAFAAILRAQSGPIIMSDAPPKPIPKYARRSQTWLYQVTPISSNLILSYLAEPVLGLPRSH